MDSRKVGVTAGGHANRTDLSIVLCELHHEITQCHNAIARHGIVNRSTQPTDTAVTAQRYQAGGLGIVLKFFVQFFRRQTKGHVHNRTIFLVGVASIIAVGIINRIVQKFENNSKNGLTRGKKYIIIEILL